MSNVDFFIAGSIHQGSDRFKRQTVLRFYEFFSVTRRAHSLAVVMCNGARKQMIEFLKKEMEYT